MTAKPLPGSGDSRPLYGEQTRLALSHFTIDPVGFPPAFIRVLGLIKACAAEVNGQLGVLAPELADAIAVAAGQVAAGEHDDQFPVSIYQTGSGTSTHMNANEVIATLASEALNSPVHPNDHVNRGQSSNDVIPTAIHVSAAIELVALIDTLETLRAELTKRAQQFQRVVKTARTHLMDAVPMTLGQELGGWAGQLALDTARLRDTQKRLLQLAQGGTAVGTGLNAHPQFATRFAAALSARTGLEFVPAANAFTAISTQNTAAELSGQLRVTALSLLKIATDLRWMNSGPVSGLKEITLPELQPGSSIMPGKVNPVIPEAVGMACVQVLGLDAAVAVAAQDNRFQLATMLPLIASNLLTQLSLLKGATTSLTERAVRRFEVNESWLLETARRNAMLVTALTPKIGYDLSAAIAKKALSEHRPIIEVATEMTGLSEDALREMLDPLTMPSP